MDSTNNAALSKKSTPLYGLIAMVVIAVIAAVVSSSNSFRLALNPSENDKNRIILAKIFTSYNSIQFVVFKIRTDVGIDIEIYEKDSTTFFQKLKQKFSFPDDKNAFLMIDGNSITLALSDVDKDGVDDIVVPTVDQYGLSRLNIFKYDADLNQFSQSVTNE